MATANEETRDALLRHQVALLRYSAGLRNRILRLIDRAEPELRGRLLDRLDTARARGFDTGPVTTARLRQLQDFLSSLSGTFDRRQRDLFDKVDALVLDELRELARDEVNFVATTLERSVGVVVSWTIPTTAELSAIVTSRPFQGAVLRDWLKRFREGDRRRMLEAVQIGMISGETPTQIGRRVFGSANLNRADGVRAITRRGAQALAQTAVAAITNNAKAAFFQANRRYIKRELYVATLDSRTTPICRALDGKTYDVGKGPRPPVHINCRSVRVPVVDGEAVGTRPADATTEEALRGLRGPARREAVRKLVGQVPAAETYQTWLTKQPAGFQDSVLGPARGALFRRGQLPLDRFVDRAGKPYTLRQLRDLEPEAFRRAGL